MLTLATFNVKDLFVPAPGAGPDLLALWQAKLADVARRIQRSGAQVVALQEVGGQAGLDALLAVLGAPWLGACAAPNARGIANAMVSTLPFRLLRMHYEAVLPFPTFMATEPAPFGTHLSLGRTIVEAGFDTPVGNVHVFCIHLKSNLPQPQVYADGAPVPAHTGRSRGESQVRSLVMRVAEALYVRGLVDAACLETPHVVVTGDCNDLPGSIPLRVMQGEPNDPSHQEMRTVQSAIPEHKRYTALFRGRTQTLDHMLVSPALAAHLASADTDLEGLRDHGPFDPNAPPTPDSDHALVLARFA
jgi:endonuclease/exonuclease/phosphatase family metal-dependent hydrolase